MSELKDIMAFRENISHFSQDRIPERAVIDQILKDAHNLIPVKNNQWNYYVDVYGPEHQKEKKSVALQTITGYGKRDFAPGGPEHDNIELLEEMYDEWLESRKPVDENSKHIVRRYKSYGFNDQVRAPYLLVYYQKPAYPTEKQLEQGYRTRLINNSDGDSHWYISASMHGYGVSLLCAEQKIHASFCKCYYHSYANYTNILAPLKHGFKNVAFLLGIGYRDESMPYYKNINKPNYEEIVTWK